MLSFLYTWIVSPIMKRNITNGRYQSGFLSIENESDKFIIFQFNKFKCSKIFLCFYFDATPLFLFLKSKRSSEKKLVKEW